MTLREDLIKILIHPDDCAILTLGNEFRGDDSLGIDIGNRLKKIPHIGSQIVNAHNVPINFLGSILRLQPKNIVIIDAVDIEQEAGTIVLFGSDLLSNVRSKTHFQSISDFLRLIKQELNYQPTVFFLGIQIKTNQLFCEMSKEVLQSIDKLERIFLSIFNKEEILNN